MPGGSHGSSSHGQVEMPGNYLYVCLLASTKSEQLVVLCSQRKLELPHILVRIATHTVSGNLENACQVEVMVPQVMVRVEMPGNYLYVCLLASTKSEQLVVLCSQSKLELPHILSELPHTLSAAILRMHARWRSWFLKSWLG